MPDTPYILTVPLQIRVDREDGTPYLGLDAIRDFLTHAAEIGWDSEGESMSDGHQVTAMQVDWEKLQHGMVGTTCWKCQSCDAEAVELDNFELLDAGTPWCSECDGPMEMTITNRIKCVRVEYDLKYYGGDYSGTGEYAYVPFSLCDEIKNPDGKCVMDDEKALNNAFEQATGHDCQHIIHYTFDEPVDQDGNAWQ